jgi:hypothetical protein
MIRAAALSCLAVAAATPAAAQQVQPVQLDFRTVPRLDRVVATVNDAVILESEILRLMKPTMDSLERTRNKPVEPAERHVLFVRNLHEKIDQHTLAQAAKTLGILPPDRVEAFFQEILREEERELVRALGTYQKVTEEQAREGRNWEAWERDQRVDKLSQLAKELSVRERLMNQHNLFITPRMMRDYYRRNRDQFVHGSRAVLGSVAFLGPSSEAVAQQAAEAWQKEPLEPVDLVARFQQQGACLPEKLLLDDNSRKTRRVDQVDFALAGPKDRVSAPIPGSEGHRLWKVMEYAEASSAPFEDAAVQQAIRARMETEVLDRLLRQVLRRARERTEVWQPQDLLTR